MSFMKPYLQGIESMVSTSNDLERLTYALQRIENGVFYNFKGQDMFNGAVAGLEELNIEVLKVERVTETTRFTSALQRDFNAGMKKVYDSITRLSDGSYEVAPERTILDDLYDVVAKGDVKAFRDIRTKLKEKWFALDTDVVGDAILDLADAVSDKDVEYAKEIVERVECDDETPVKKEEPKATKKEEPKATKKEEPKATKKEEPTEADITEEEFEIIEDIKSAIDDGDEADFKELLKELKEVNEGLYNEWKGAFKTSPETEDDGIVAEILEDLDKAIEEGDEADFKELLKELKEEAGADSDIYKEYAAKCEPKKTTRRERRGR